MESLITQLEELGVSYVEDPDTGSLDISVSELDKAGLVDLIIALTEGGYLFDITETSITVDMGTSEPVEDTEELDEDAYLDDAFANM